jgi:hypothetical protein
VSLFNVRGAMELMQGSQSQLPVQKALPMPAMPTLQLGSLRLKVMPDFTPSRALVWGTILSLWCVGGLTVQMSKRMGIHSVADVQDRCAMALAPVAARARNYFSPLKQRVLAPGARRRRVAPLCV